jgi:hypothetical protein
MPVGETTAVPSTELADDELCALALAADPETKVDDDAVSFWDLTSRDADPSLPDWYMPAPMTGGRLLRGWQRVPVGLVIASFLVINAFGLCNTYGHLGFT